MTQSVTGEIWLADCIIADTKWVCSRTVAHICQPQSRDLILFCTDLKIIWRERRWWLPKVQAVMNQSLPPFSHFTSVLLLCIFPFIVKIEICSCPLSVLPITWNEHALIYSLPTSIFVHLVFLSGHGFLPFFVLFTISSTFSLVTTLCPCLCLSGNYTPSFPCCQILAQTCSASHPSSFQCHVQLVGCPASLPTTRQPCIGGGILFQLSFVLLNKLLWALVRGISLKRRALCTKAVVTCEQHSQRKVWWLQSAFCFCSRKSSETQGAATASAPKNMNWWAQRGWKGEQTALSATSQCSLLQDKHWQAPIQTVGT